MVSLEVLQQVAECQQPDRMKLVGELEIWSWQWTLVKHHPGKFKDGEISEYPDTQAQSGE
jgi:hypothetical protein